MNYEATRKTINNFIDDRRGSSNHATRQALSALKKLNLPIKPKYQSIIELENALEEFLPLNVVDIQTGLLYVKQ